MERLFFGQKLTFAPMPNWFAIQPELISIHIPKTAGSSFHAVLKSHYGWQLKHIQHSADIKTWSTGQPYRSNKPLVKAVHGHIRPHQNWKIYYPKAKWVCWLRNPAQRTWSAYHHLQRTQHLGDRNQTLFRQLQPNFETFLTHPEFTPVTQIYSRFLGSFQPQDFAFIGRTAHFEADLQAFGQLIGAKSLQTQRINVGEKAAVIPNDLQQQSREILKMEFKIYHKFLSAFHHED